MNILQSGKFRYPHLEQDYELRQDVVGEKDKYGKYRTYLGSFDLEATKSKTNSEPTEEPISSRIDVTACYDRFDQYFETLFVKIYLLEQALNKNGTLIFKLFDIPGPGDEEPELKLTDRKIIQNKLDRSLEFSLDLSGIQKLNQFELAVFLLDDEDLEEEPKMLKDNGLKACDVLKSLWNDSNTSDVTIKSMPDYLNGEVTSKPCHKIILSKRSDVFYKLFHKKKCESNAKNNVEFVDTIMDSKTLDQFVQFIYTDNLELNTLTTQQCIELLSASHKYEINLLKAETERYLVNTVSVESVFACIQAAHLLGCQLLKGTCMNLILENTWTLVNPEWIKLCQNSPPLYEEIRKEITKKWATNNKQSSLQ